MPLTEVSAQPSAIPGGNPPGDWQSAVGWGDARFEPGTAGQQYVYLKASKLRTLQEIDINSTIMSMQTGVKT